MPRQYLPRFDHPSALRQIDPACLIELARPFEDFLSRHDVRLPADPAQLDIDRLGLALLQPHGDAPYELVDALTHIHEMADYAAMEALLEEAARVGIDLPDNGRNTPADVAVRVWLADPNLLRRKHAEHVVHKRRSFESFLPRDNASLVRMPNLRAALGQFESDVSAWFRAKGRGAGASLLVFDEDDELRLVVRHGGPYRREGCLNDGVPGTVHFRPLEFHFIVIDWRTWELRVNCKTKGETRMYREMTGRHLLGQHDFFTQDKRKYTLEPLRQLGRRSLVCTDIQGIQHVRLVQLQMYLGGPYSRRRIDEADDVFLALEEAGEMIPTDGLLTKAKLEFVFRDSPKPRPVVITAMNRSQYTRDGDASLVEEFLQRRGFAMGTNHAAVACA